MVARFGVQRRLVKRLIFVVAVALGASGCMTLFGSKTQTVSFWADMSGTTSRKADFRAKRDIEVTINGVSRGPMPVTVTLDRYAPHTLDLHLDGFTDFHGTIRPKFMVALAVVEAFFIVPLVVDLAAGTLYTLEVPAWSLAPTYVHSAEPLVAETEPRGVTAVAAPVEPGAGLPPTHAGIKFGVAPVSQIGEAVPVAHLARLEADLKQAVVDQCRLTGCIATLAPMLAPDLILAVTVRWYAASLLVGLTVRRHDGTIAAHAEIPTPALTVVEPSLATAIRDVVARACAANR